MFNIKNKTPVLLTSGVDLGAAADNLAQVFKDAEVAPLPLESGGGSAYAVYCGDNVVIDTAKLNSETGLDYVVVYYKTNSVQFTHYAPAGTVTIPRVLVERIAISQYEP